MSKIDSPKDCRNSNFRHRRMWSNCEIRSTKPPGAIPLLLLGPRSPTRCVRILSLLPERLVTKLMFTTGPVPSEYLKADTKAKQGFSLRVAPWEPKNGTSSLLFISGGRPQVGFPARAKLERYLPRHKKEVDTYARLLSELGLEFDEYGENQRPSLPRDMVVPALDRLSDCVLALADRPSTS